MGKREVRPAVILVVLLMGRHVSTMLRTEGTLRMARYSGARWRPISVNYNRGGIAPRILIVHIMQGTLAGTDSWFRNPAAEASAHFGVDKTGTTYQWVDTANRAWHAADANSYAIGVECEGFSGQTLTAAQVTAVAKIYAWAHQQHEAISMWLNKKISGSGLSWHGLGGVAWGNHPNCPGKPIVGQLPEILTEASAILNPPVAWYWHALLGYFTANGDRHDHASGYVTIAGVRYYWHASPASGEPYFTRDGHRASPPSGVAVWG